MNDLINLVKQYAPTLAAGLLTGGSGAVVTSIAAKFGTSADIGSIVQAMAADPAAAQKLQELELEFFKIEAQDRDSAREMQTATKSYFVPALGTMIVGSFIGVVFATLLGLTNVDSILAGTLIGYLSAKAEQVISFYFGSSHGSQAKDQLLYNSEPKK